jgi:hypothetical protein
MERETSVTPSVPLSVPLFKITIIYQPLNIIDYADKRAKHAQK